MRQITAECDKSLANGDLASTFEKDSQWHLEIARRSGNQDLYEDFEKIDAKVQLARLIVHLPRDILTTFIGQHQEILQAMRRREIVLAQSLITHHILKQLQRYRAISTDKRR